MEVVEVVPCSTIFAFRDGRSQQVEDDGFIYVFFDRFIANIVSHSRPSVGTGRYNFGLAYLQEAEGQEIDVLSSLSTVVDR